MLLLLFFFWSLDLNKFYILDETPSEDNSLTFLFKCLTSFIIVYRISCFLKISLIYFMGVLRFSFFCHSSPELICEAAVSHIYSVYLRVFLRIIVISHLFTYNFSALWWCMDYHTDFIFPVLWVTTTPTSCPWEYVKTPLRFSKLVIPFVKPVKNILIRSCVVSCVVRVRIHRWEVFTFE